MTDSRIGHNNPPIEVILDPEAIADTINAEHSNLLSRRDELLAGVARFHESFPSGIDTDADAGKASDFVRQLKQASKDGELAHKAYKRPFLEAGRAVDLHLKTHVADALMLEARRIEGMLTAHAAAKAAKARKEAAAAALRQREEADRLAAAAERTRNRDLIDSAIAADAAAALAEKAATGKSADLSRIRGDHGAVMSLRDDWTYEVVDITQVPPELLAPKDSLVMGRINAGVRDIPGLRIFNAPKAIVR